ncbi:MAG: hypothetical protein M0Q41_04845 [Bacteroidales bacterium]|nr:hypothetical protein [Bacteroidales bacterium]
MWKSKILWVCFIFFPATLLAFEGIGSIGGRSAAMGNASVALTDFWAIQNNPAGIALQQNITAGFAYQSRFMMKELSLKSVAVSAPMNFGVLGLSFNQFGYSLYNENKLGIAYARAFGANYRLGIQLDYLYHYIADDYEHFKGVTFELGAQADITDNFSIGAYVFNLPHLKRSKLTNEMIPIILRFGFLYKFTPSLIGLAEFGKGLDFEPDLRFGAEYEVTSYFVVRSGIGVNPGIVTFGTGLLLNAFSFDIAAELHPVLGASLQAGLIYTFPKKSN